MTRKDYVMLAAALRQSRVLSPKNIADALNPGIERAARCMANALASDNPRFDRDRFLRACGVLS